jgi:hypothetical protein
VVAVDLMGKKRFAAHNFLKSIRLIIMAFFQAFFFLAAANRYQVEHCDDAYADYFHCDEIVVE